MAESEMGNYLDVVVPGFNLRIQDISEANCLDTLQTILADEKLSRILYLHLIYRLTNYQPITHDDLDAIRRDRPDLSTLGNLVGNFHFEFTGQQKIERLEVVDGRAILVYSHQRGGKMSISIPPSLLADILQGAFSGIDKPTSAYGIVPATEVQREWVALLVARALKVDTL